MATAVTYNKTGTKGSDLELNGDIFGVEVKSHDLIKQAYNTHQANLREAHADTLTRGKVRGGGRKPWRQKGTGRARHGSIRSPIWRGGGITFGPSTDANYTRKMSKKSKRVAIKQALSLAAKRGSIAIIDEFSVSDGKTKTAAELLKKLDASRRTVVVVADKTKELELATRNITDLKITQQNYLNVFDILNADHLIIEKATLPPLSDWLGGTK